MINNFTTKIPKMQENISIDCAGQKCYIKTKRKEVKNERDKTV